MVDLKTRNKLKRYIRYTDSDYSEFWSVPIFFTIVFTLPIILGPWVPGIWYLWIIGAGLLWIATDWSKDMYKLLIKQPNWYVLLDELKKEIDEQNDYSR